MSNTDGLSRQDWEVDEENDRLQPGGYQPGQGGAAGLAGGPVGLERKDKSKEKKAKEKKKL